MKQKKAGLILRRTACDYLRLMRGTQDEVQKITERGDLKEIERYTGAISILDAVIHKLCPVLALRDKIVPPRHLFSILIYTEEPEKELKGFLDEMKKIKEPRRAELIIMMLNEVHDEWVEQHSCLFFDLSRQYLQCRFMPMELIGFDAVRQYLVYIENLLDLFGWAVDEKLLMMAYRLMQDKFYLRNELRSDGDLVTFVAKADYEALSPRIRKELMGNYDLARKMVYS